MIVRHALSKDPLPDSISLLDYGLDEEQAQRAYDKGIGESSPALKSISSSVLKEVSSDGQKRQSFKEFIEEL